jgi:hypothetical protein
MQMIRHEAVRNYVELVFGRRSRNLRQDEAHDFVIREDNPPLNRAIR